MPRYKFDEVKLSQAYKAKCNICKKVMKRTLTDYQTINPFNKNQEGFMKSRSEIYAELMQTIPQKIKTIQEKGIICRKCEVVGNYAN